MSSNEKQKAEGMRGLATFITELRECNTKEEEEKRINKELGNIRSKFKSGSIDGYQRRKYVSKLLYMYIIGYEIDFGHMEAVALITSTKYSEKQIGYLAITLLFDENSDMLKLMVNSIKKDLTATNDNFTCLALHAISNVCSKEMADTLVDDILRHLTSPTTKPLVKKKAALCLLKVYKKFPTILVNAHELADKFLPLLDDYDVGVVLSASSLIYALVQQHPLEYAGCIDKSVNRLYQIAVENQSQVEHHYYRVPVPWLQVKLLKLLQIYPGNILMANINVKTKLERILNELIVVVGIKHIQQSNAQNAILFESIQLLLKLSDAFPSSDLIQRSVNILSDYLTGHDINLKYLSLDTLVDVGFNHMPLIKHLFTQILSLLSDKDVSVRKRSMDLTYVMCDSSNAEAIVTELVTILKTADQSMKEDMVLKIAILTEKFTNNNKWYVDIMLQLLSIAGDHINEHVWYRLVEVIVNKKELHLYATQSIFNTIQSYDCHEPALKAAAYLLGEYGDLIAENPGSSPAHQFHALNSKFYMVSLSTRAIMLTTFFKFVNLFPEVKALVADVFRKCSTSIDTELQNRACDYLAVISMISDDYIQLVCEEMPQFPEKESNRLLTLLEKKDQDGESVNVWKAQTEKVNNDVQNVDLLSGVGPATTTATAFNAPAAVRNVANVTPQWLALAVKSDGVLFEDEVLQIGVKSEYKAPQGRMVLFFGNKQTVALENFTVVVQPIAGLNVNVAPLANSIPTRTQLQQVLSVEISDAFKLSPTITIGFSVNGQAKSFTLLLPVHLVKFNDPISLSPNDFLTRWNQLGESKQYQKIVTSSANVGSVKQIFTNLRFALLENESNAVVGASVCNIGKGKVGCLAKAEFSADGKLRLTLRTTSDSVTNELGVLLEKLV